MQLGKSLSIEQRMKFYLTRKNRKTTDFVILETENNFLHSTIGKIGKTGFGRSTLNAESSALCIEEATKTAAEYRKKGYVDTELTSDLLIEDIVFDKAKWHINKDFPKDLDHYQSYVYSGLFVWWLVDNGFLKPKLQTDLRQQIISFKHRKMAPAKFYEEYLDGVFSSDGFILDAVNFSKSYFDVNNGQYVRDYLKILDPKDEFPSVFHVKDTWENYDRLKDVITRRHDEWKMSTK